MREFFVVFFFLLAALSACNSSDGAYDYGDVAAFELLKRDEEALEAEIEAFLTLSPEIKRATVQLDGGTAVVGLDLAGKRDDGELAKIKRDVIRHVREKCASIKHVAVSAAPELYERIFSARGSGLGMDNELFDIPVPLP